MTESEYTFALFPYLNTSGPVHYRGLTIRSSDDLADLPPDATRHLKTILTMFFLRDHLRIQKVSYAFHAPSKDPSKAYQREEAIIVDPHGNIRLPKEIYAKLEEQEISSVKIIMNDNKIEIIPFKEKKNDIESE